MTKIIWQESGQRIVSDQNIRLIEAGKDFYKYEGDFSDEELIKFLNFQLNRKIESKIEILSIVTHGIY